MDRDQAQKVVVAALARGEGQLDSDDPDFLQAVAEGQLDPSVLPAVGALRPKVRHLAAARLYDLSDGAWLSVLARTGYEAVPPDDPDAEPFQALRAQAEIVLRLRVARTWGIRVFNRFGRPLKQEPIVYIPPSEDGTEWLEGEVPAPDQSPEEIVLAAERAARFRVALDTHLTAEERAWLDRLGGEENDVALARRWGFNRRTVYRWRKRLQVKLAEIQQLLDHQDQPSREEETAVSILEETQATLGRIEERVCDTYRAVDDIANLLVHRFPDDEALAAAVQNWKLSRIEEGASR